jgi:hypothetical protein
MKTLGKIVGAILLCLILVLVVLRITGLNPRDRTPGLWLTGNLVTTPVADWSFTDAVPTVKIQTRTWYGLPHSVTINCIAYNGKLYLTSTYPMGTPKSWDENVMRDPHVRLKIGDQLYDRTLFTVTDPDERTGELAARVKKYPQLKIAPNSTVNIFRVDE